MQRLRILLREIDGAKEIRLKKARKMLPYILLLPALVPIGVVVFYPMFTAVLASFYRSAALALTKSSVFVGLRNYQSVLTGDFLDGLKLTLIYAASVVFSAYIIGLAVALVLNLSFRGRGFVRAILVIPWAVPTVVVAIVWMWMYNPQYGVFNYLLTRLHLIKSNISWLSDPSTAMLSLIIATVWKRFPFVTIMLLAGLQTIPTEQYEAADIDGAGRFQKFRFITLPALSAINGILIVLMLIWGLGEFVMIFLLTAGGPARLTETLVVKIYLRAFKYFHLGEAAALGVILLTMSSLLSLIYMIFITKKGKEA